jgi:uncharacterized protein (DUF1330 family)
MATAPRPDQLAALLERAPAGTLYMINLVKFRDHASYPDGRETDLSGAEAYAIYGQAVAPMVADLGGRIAWVGFPHTVLIGESGDGDWDQVAIVEYPSLDAFRAMTESGAYAEAHIHREAGLESQLLINCLGPEQIGSAGGLPI